MLDGLQSWIVPSGEDKIPALRENEILFHNRPVRGLVSKTTGPSQLANKAPYQRFPKWTDPSRSATISQRISVHVYISAIATLKFTYFSN
jgi:hypothetical protein